MTPTEDPGLVSSSLKDGLASVARPDARDAKTQRDAELQALLARVEAATGPDRELDAHLWAATEGRSINIERGIVFADAPDGDRMPMGFIDPGKHNSNFTIRSNFKCPDYSASLDAALALVERVLPDAGWLCGIKSEGGFMAELFRTRYVSGVIPRLSYAAAPTPALALLAALLKALASQQPRDQQVAGDRSRDAPLPLTSEADEKR